MNARYRIWITRPSPQSERLLPLLQDEGFETLVLPLLETEPLSDPSPLRAVLSDLERFDLVIFTSPSALHAVLGIIEIPWPTTLPVAFMGSSSATYAISSGITRIIQPLDSETGSEALLKHPFLKAVAGCRVLVFRGDYGRELLIDVLQARGADVLSVQSYRRLLFDDPIKLIKELDRGCDGLIVSSSEAARHLFDLGGVSTHQQLKAIPYFVPHRRIVTILASLGVHQIQLTTPHEIELVDAIKQYYLNLKPLHNPL